MHAELDIPLLADRKEEEAVRKFAVKCTSSPRFAHWFPATPHSQYPRRGGVSYDQYIEENYKTDRRKKLSSVLYETIVEQLCSEHSVVKPLSLTLCPVLTLFGLSFVFFHSVRRKNFIFTLIWTCVRTFFTNLVCYLPCFARRDEHLINCSFSFRKPLPIYHLTQSSTVFPLLSSPFQQGTRFLLCA